VSDSPVRLIVFDAGGVLIRVAGPWEAAQARAGVPFNERVRSAEFATLSAALREQHQLGELETSRYLELVAGAADVTPGQVAQILDAWIADEYPGWDAVLERLERAGIEAALLSNTNAYHWESMAPWGSRSGPYPAIARLGHHFASHLLRLRKPDPAIYRAVERATGHQGDQVLFFDDLPANVDGARLVGWRAVLVDPAGDPAAQVLGALTEAGIPAL
jgi:putative hydrolase of the HAD superfamily